MRVKWDKPMLRSFTNLAIKDPRRRVQLPNNPHHIE